MKSLALVLVFATAVLADGFGSHGHSNHRSGRAGFRRPQGRGSRRGGRQDELGAYAAPEAVTEALPPIDEYDYEESIDTYGNGLATEASTVEESIEGDPLSMLQSSIPGVPGEDYPIYAEVPESGFACEGQVDGGYYADPEAECQVFHICTADGQGGLAKYSFLCPNGTIFNQNYFICDWWFNFDCAEAEALYALNEDIAAERDAATAADPGSATGETVASYAAPVPAPLDEAYDYPADYAAYDDALDVTDAPTEAAPVYDYPVDYPAEEGSGLDVYGEETTLAPLEENYLPPLEEARRRKSFGRSGRKGGRQQGRRGGRRQGRRQQKNRRPGRQQGRRSFRG